MTELEECAGPGDWADLPPEEGCEVANFVLQCFYTKVGYLCGESVATITKELMEAVFCEVLDTKCDFALPQDVSFMPELNSGQVAYNSKLVIIFLFLMGIINLFLLYFYTSVCFYILVTSISMF